MKTDKNALTQADKDYIKTNRLDLSMNNMADFIGKPYTRVRDYMRANNLQLNKEQLTALRVTNTNNGHKNKPHKAKNNQSETKKERAWDWDALP